MQLKLPEDVAMRIGRNTFAYMLPCSNTNAHGPANHSANTEQNRAPHLQSVLLPFLSPEV